MLHTEQRLLRALVVVAVQDSKAVKTLFQVFAQRALEFLMQFLILEVLATPLLRLHLGACEDEQIAIQKGIGGAGSGHKKANGVATLL